MKNSPNTLNTQAVVSMWSLEGGKRGKTTGLPTQYVKFIVKSYQ